MSDPCDHEPEEMVISFDELGEVRFPASRLDPIEEDAP